MSEFANYLQNAGNEAGFQSAPVSAISASGSLSTIISRIEEAIDLETSAIRTDTRFDIKSSNARKGRYLYELNKAMKGMQPTDLRQEHRAGIQRLRSKLAENEVAILAHLDAVNEVARLLKDAIQRSDADGTYSAHQFGYAT